MWHLDVDSARSLVMLAKQRYSAMLRFPWLTALLAKRFTQQLHLRVYLATLKFAHLVAAWR